ncbi:hypothetical protein [Streptomyces sp. NPDC046909]|uniref:hypothetical protein n=1 Tax=Streptomyces sp. NPDC046909 TaxID=3155617 RepID=UPI0033D4CD63
MVTVVLIGVVLLAIGGCVCVVWAERGGPRWVRVVAAVTIGLGQVVSSSGKRRSSGGGDQSDSGGDGN